MYRGMKAVVAKLDEGVAGDLAAVCKQVATTLISSVGGAAGPLYGTLFLRMAPVLGANTAVDATTFAAAPRAGVDGVVARGRAELGDKTMIDALVPAGDALDAALSAGAGLPEALRQAADAAAAGRGPRRHPAPGSPQGPGQLPRRTQRRPPRPRCGLVGDADRRGRDRRRGPCLMTVGLVVVGHSRALAHASVALVQMMIHGSGVPITVAAGLDETTFGTDATAIADAIAAADQGQGVVVLMDLGSAVLSAELALDLIDDVVRDRVVLCPAPLVECLLVAAVTAAGGADAHWVCDEACAALAGKIAQLQPQGPAPTAGG